MAGQNTIDPYAVAVGERLAQARKAASPAITQAAAAEKFTEMTGVDLSWQAISMYECGRRLPPPQTVMALCKIYGTATPSYILGFEDGAQSLQEAHLLKLYRSADSRGKQTITRVADAESPYLKQGDPSQDVA